MKYYFEVLSAYLLQIIYNAVELILYSTCNAAVIFKLYQPKGFPMSH